MRNIDRILVVAGVQSRIIPTEGVFQELVLLDQQTGETLTFPLVPGQYELMQEFYADVETERDTTGWDDRQENSGQGEAESGEAGARQDQARGIGKSDSAGLKAAQAWKAADTVQDGQEGMVQVVPQGEARGEIPVYGEVLQQYVQAAPGLGTGRVGRDKGMSDF